MVGVLIVFIPLAVTLAAILVFKFPNHYADLLGTIVTWFVVIFYSHTDPFLLSMAWIYGILVPLSYFLVSIPTWIMTYHMMYHEFFTDIRKLMKNVALIGAYGEEYKSLRTTFVIGLIITALTIIPLLSFLLWP